MIPFRYNRRSRHCLAGNMFSSASPKPSSICSIHIPLSLGSIRIFHRGFLCNAVRTCTLFFHEFFLYLGRLCPPDRKIVSQKQENVHLSYINFHRKFCDKNRQLQNHFISTAALPLLHTLLSLRECNRHLKQISIQIQLEFTALQLCQALGDGEAKAAAFRISGDITADKTLCQFICRNIQRLR